MERLSVVIIICLVVGLAPGYSLWPGHAEVVDRIAAEVNDEIITMSELDEMMRMVQPQTSPNLSSKEAKDLKRQMLEALIDRKLAKAEAKKRGITISDKEIDQAVEDVKKKNHIPDDAALNQAAAKAGMTIKELRQQLADQIQQERMMAVAVGAKKAEFSDAEVRRFYDTNLRDKSGGNQVHLEVVNMPFLPGATTAQKEGVQKKAEAVLKDLRLGMSLAEIQRKHSLTAQDLGFINQADLNRQLAEVLSKLRPGEVAPIQNPEGFHLVVLVGKRSVQPLSFEEAVPRIRQLLSGKIMEKQFMEWVKTLREKVYIKIML